MKRFLLCFLLCGFTTAPEWEDELSQQRYQSLIHEVRCPTCQNSNIAESNAPLAQQLRHLVAEQIRQGRSDMEIRAHLLERYGDFISYQPPFRASTWLLWLSPLFLMAFLFYSVWQRKRFRNRLKLEPLNITLQAEKRLPFWLYGIGLMLFAAAIWAWWAQSASWRRWYEIQHGLSASVTQALHLRRYPDFQQLDFPPLFCQAMQAHLARNDAHAAISVGDCYQMTEMHDWARQAYRLALRLQPENLRLKAHYVQADLFARPNQAIGAETERLLRELISAEPEVLMHRILLAAAYEKSNRAAEALPLWQSLAEKTGDADLERYIQERIQAATWRLPIEIKICEGDFPPEALLFVSVARQAQPKPPMMARVLPILATQEALFTAADSMLLQREALPERDLKIMAFISANGRVDGERLRTQEKNLDALQKISLELCP